ncbi:Cof-type HAD-IIB family hydrolase [Candidatus Clostridium stratigraminis]|uniref:Cof-type HAD-IIB family hydrolase n=1 Tax=Candidatus Clostridium stratigraminis TaxID=3381661 RepID=A0ABW8T445_9CLOT
MYKLLAVDMDGTLLNSDKIISNTNKEAIKNAIKKGTKVVITSGRGLKGLEKYLKEVNLTGENQYLIGNNGGTIYRTSDFKCIAYKGLRGKDFKKIHSMSRKYGFNMIGYTHEGVITAEENELSRFEAKFLETAVKTINIETGINDEDEVAKIILSQKRKLFFTKKHELPEKFLSDYNVVKTSPRIFEVMDKDCNKGYGVKALADKLGIKKEEVICIGDQANDIEMITYAGLGVAMGNAIEEVKAAAQYITSDNDNDGVAKAIEKFIL